MVLDPDARRRTRAVRRLARWLRRATVYGTLDPGGWAARLCAARQLAAEQHVAELAAWDASDDERTSYPAVPTGDDAHLAAAAEHYHVAYQRYRAAADRLRAGREASSVYPQRGTGEVRRRDRHDRRW